MKKLALFFLLCLLPACAGAVTWPPKMKGVNPDPPADLGWTFRDIVGQSYATNYGWYDPQIVSNARALYLGSGALTINGAQSYWPEGCVQWSVAAGDNPIGNGSDRDEYAGMFGSSYSDETAQSGTEYYALSVLIPSGWIDPNGSAVWFIIFQEHGPNTNTGHSAQANFQFLLASNYTGSSPDHYAIRSVGGPIGSGGSIPSQDDVFTDLGPHIYDTRVDWVFAVTWGSDVDGTGHVTAWMRSTGNGTAFRQVANYSAPTLYSSSGVDQPAYAKRGIYRNPDNSNQPTETTYVGPLTRASTFQDAVIGSFGG